MNYDEKKGKRLCQALSSMSAMCNGEEHAIQSLSARPLYSQNIIHGLCWTVAGEEKKTPIYTSKRIGSNQLG